MSDLVNTELTLPGTSAQQALLRGIVNAYTADERVLAVGVLGSLGRSAWDEWSDLDLDVIVVDDAVPDAVTEARALCEVLGQPDAFAGQDLKDRLGGLLAQADLPSIAQSLANALDLIADDELTSGRFALTHTQRMVLEAIRQRAIDGRDSVSPGSKRY